jgi:serine/threonine protein kinase
MPKINTTIFRKILYYLDPADRTKLFGGAFSWKYLFTTAYNITSAVAAVHARGHLVGDLNESNILVAPNALITLIDCDSFQVRDPNTNQIFRCPVGKPEFTAPEIQGKSYRDVDRTPETDNFALAVLLFQLLMEGTHPYQAKGRLVDDAPSTQAKILKGYFPYGLRPGKDLAPPDYAPPYEIIPPELQELFGRCFKDGHTNPQARPSARDWFHSLRRFGNRFEQCPRNPNHFFLDHLTACPWCQVATKKGKDPFPSPIGQQVMLADPTNTLDGLEKRLDYLRSYVMMALADGVLTAEEESQLMALGVKLQLPPKDVERLIQDELKKVKAKRGSSVGGIPKLEVSKNRFEFNNLRVGEVQRGSFVINNVGGGALQGSVASNQRWLHVLRSQIDPTRHRQEFEFEVDTTGLPFGLKQTGVIEIRSNGGTEQVLVDLSVEVPEAALGRFRTFLTWMGLLGGGLLGYVLYALLPELGVRQVVANLASWIALVAVVVVGSKKAGFSGGCGGFFGMSVLLSILGFFPHALAAVAWALTFGMLLHLFSRKLFLVRQQGTNRVVQAVGIAAVVLVAVVVLVAFGLVGTQKQAASSSQQVAPLQLGTFTTASAVTAWRNYSPKNQFRPGERVCVYAEAFNVSNGQKIDLVYDFMVSAPNNVQLWARNSRHSRNTRGPSFAAWDCFALPENALPGSYTATVQIRNNLTGQSGTLSTTFSVAPTNARLIQVGGHWQGSFTTASGEVPFEAELQQQGEVLTGWVRESQGGYEALFSDIAGRVQGNQISFHKRYRSGGRQEVSYIGQLEEDGRRAAGTWSLSGLSGRWEMRRSTTPEDRSVEVSPESAAQHIERAVRLYEQRNYTAALAECEEALKLEPDNIAAIRLKNKILETQRILNQR